MYLLLHIGTLGLQLCLAARAFRQPMNDDMVGFCHLRQGASFERALPPRGRWPERGRLLCLPFFRPSLLGGLPLL